LSFVKKSFNPGNDIPERLIHYHGSCRVQSCRTIMAGAGSAAATGLHTLNRIGLGAGMSLSLPKLPTLLSLA
jgi:hypothetical protein